LASVEELHPLGADHLPIVAELLEFRKIVDRQDRLIGHAGKHIHENIVGCGEGRMIGDLATEPQPLAAAKVHIKRRASTL
jgi:hypothetical protein